MEKELIRELEGLNGKLDNLLDKIQDVDDDVKSLASDVKEIKSDVAGQGREISRIQATMDHNKSEIEKLHAENQKLWDHFPKHKDDMKEYAEIIAQQEANKIKMWAYGLLIIGAGAIIGHLIKLAF